MRAEAFGEIGLLPSDFYRMRYRDYLLLQKGFANKRIYEQKIVRKAVTILLQPYMEKGKSIRDYQIWPVHGDKEEIEKLNQQISEKNLQRLREFREKEKNQKPKDN